MTLINRSTLKAKEADLINRVAPFDGNPLIQKTEDLQLRDDHSDSQIFKIPTIAAVNNPAATFGISFALNDEINIDTTSSAPSAFVITLADLEGNSRGILNITKKVGQTFSFGNATIQEFNPEKTQDGIISFSFEVIILNGTYFVVPVYPDYNNDFIAVTPISQSILTVTAANITARKNKLGQLEFKGFLDVDRAPVGTATEIVDIMELPASLALGRDAAFVGSLWTDDFVENNQQPLNVFYKDSTRRLRAAPEQFTPDSKLYLDAVILRF